MKYFRAFRLVGDEAINEYYSIAQEMSYYQNTLFQQNIDNPEGNHSEIENKLNEVHERMYKKYNMIPHLYYHAMPETGYVSTLVNEKEYKKLKKAGEVKEGQARKLEVKREQSQKKEMAYSIPVFKIDNPKGIQEYEQLLFRWEDIKNKLNEAGKNQSPQLPSLTEQYEAFQQELRNNYNMDPSSEYVFETTSVGVYMGCSEDQLRGIAEEQKAERNKRAEKMWKQQNS